MDEAAAYLVSKATVRVLRGDITDQDTDAIVNAANSSLLGGGGVDGAIHARGGPAILAECRSLREARWPRGMPPGEAAATSGGRLRARYVIHTVGPVWQGGGAGEEEILRRCYRRSLEVAEEHGIGSVAFPSISTGAYGYPIDRAGPVAIATVEEGVARHPSIREVRFVLFSSFDLAAYSTIAKARWGR